ncbi:hypothetical protein K491DRAFT_331484 [Lophiostoma macrostomum CBS 122681]|uniref:Uncharacterized protein n=1 Tax=Lophiostoma macrostomum CBS 122681 TaxID=1314788 RepID=A0A6A6TD33_9PLEO|nr:hypothetical protein K491DRAFT_331484 [Lophiostoma macrostomum CBS 122681]
MYPKFSQINTARLYSVAVITSDSEQPLAFTNVPGTPVRVRVRPQSSIFFAVFLSWVHHLHRSLVKPSRMNMIPISPFRGHTQRTSFYTRTMVPATPKIQDISKPYTGSVARWTGKTSYRTNGWLEVGNLKRMLPLFVQELRGAGYILSYIAARS